LIVREQKEENITQEVIEALIQELVHRKCDTK
jgi:hypothetical protein